MNKDIKICFVVQRYGEEVNGGAEQECRQYAERLASEYDVSVATTKALDYSTWADWYKRDYEIIKNVKVYRFSVDKERNQEEFDEVDNRLFGSEHPEEIEQEWINKQGPYSLGLIDFLKENKDVFDVFIFSGYLYYQTVMGLPEVKEKAILISLAHDEPFLQFQHYKDLFDMPRAFFFNTEEERQLVRQKFHNYQIPFAIGGVGVNIPEHISAENFKKKYGLDHFMIYVGRIDEGKNCHVLFKNFIQYKSDNPDSKLKLVLLGKPVMKVPQRDDIISLGFVSEEDKYNGIAASDFLVLPSKYESLSMVVLEAFSLRKTVLVNGECRVLFSHCKKSHGGLFYTDYKSFASCVQKLEESRDLRDRLGKNGKSYVEKNYHWDLIMEKLKDLISYVIEYPEFNEGEENAETN